MGLGNLHRLPQRVRGAPVKWGQTVQVAKIFLLSTSLLVSSFAFGQAEKLALTIPSFYYLEEAIEEGDGKSLWVRSCRDMPSKAELQNDDLFTQTELGCTRVARIAQTDLDKLLSEMEFKLPGDVGVMLTGLLGVGLMFGSLFIRADDLSLFWPSGLILFLVSIYVWDKNDEKKMSFREFESQIQGQIVGRVEHPWALEIFTDFLNEYGVRPESAEALDPPLELR